MKTKLKDKIERLVHRGRSAAFERRGGSGDWIHGYPLEMSSEWLLLHSLVDFRLDGYAFVRLSDITGVQAHSKGEEAIVDFLRESQSAGTDLPLLDFLDVRSILRPLRARDTLVILDFEFCKEYDYLLIGKIVRLNKRTLSMWTFDSGGVWDKEISKGIPYEDISGIRVGCDYCHVFEQYLRAKGRWKPEAR